MGPLGAEGVFLGFHRSSNTCIVATSEGRCIYARAVTRRARRERYYPQALADVRKMPNDSRDLPDAPRKAFDGPAATHGPTAETTRPPALRRMRINNSDLVKYGFHKDCSQCEHIQKYGNALPGRTHSDACRRQFEEAMRATEEGRERLAAHEESTPGQWPSMLNMRASGPSSLD